MLYRETTAKSRIIAIAMAVIMAFTIYGGLGTASVMATENGQDAVVETAQPADVTEPAADDVVTDDEAVVDEAAVEEPAEEGVAAAAAEEAPAALASADGELYIKNVEVLSNPEFQSIYRHAVYQGVESNGEDPDKWYTDKREINLKDPRVFNLEFIVDGSTVGNDPEAWLESVDLQYGGFDLSKWGNGNNLRGNTPILESKDKAIVDNGDGTYTVSVSMETKCPWAGAEAQANNIPYAGYYAGRQFDFGSGQQADNRSWWQAGPAYKGVGTYALTAVKDGETLASKDIHIAPYDGAYSWIEMNLYAQSIIQAINGSELPISELNKQVTGQVAAGYVAIDENGAFVAGDENENVYVEVSILGYGLTDNYKEENKDFNNYARYNPIWNIAVAKTEKTVDSYLNETVPTMNNDPEKLIDKYKDADPEDIDMVNVYYQNNVHADEVTGTDTEIQLITDLIDGGQDGKKINYKSWTLDDMDLGYRDNTEGYKKSETGHVVKEGYNGRFNETDARQAKVFDTGEALDSFIFVTNITNNPDGKAGMRRVNRYAFDLNRDAVFSTMPETTAVIKDLMKWDPLVMNEWHGYVQNMLIEPCTAPHDPAYDYDLLASSMQNLTYAAGLAVTANTAYDTFLVPWDHYDGGDWDDGGTIYAPMFAELLGTFGYTIEFPHANTDSLEAGNVINYAMIDELLHGETEFFPGNRLNGALEDVDGNMRDSHEVDIIDKSMRKNTVLAKLETKLRGINNVDSMAADKYFIDKKINSEGQKEDKVVGRARPVDENGNTLPFFPDYIVVPVGDAQYNVAEGIKGINQLKGWGIEVDVSTKDVEYKGQTIPAGSYVLNMKQANRNVIFEVMSKGYDATNFADMYADIYCNLPDVRGFDSIQVYGEDVFKGKLKEQPEIIKKTANIQGTVDEYVVFKSQSTDAVRFVNLLLSGKSSGGSTAAKGDVWMLKKDVEGVGSASDYVIESSQLSKLKKLKDNTNINLNGCQLEGKYISELPEEAVQLVEPVIQLNTTRTAQTGGILWFLLDDYLGFGSLSDYNGSTDVREGANVILANNMNANAFNDSYVEAVKSGQAGLVMIRSAAALGKLGSTAPTTTSFQDVAINGEYNVDKSLYTANYATTTTYYARGYAYKNIPEGSKVLFKSLENGEEAFIGGFQPTEGKKDAFGDKVTIFSTLLDGEDFAEPVQAVAFGQQMDYRSHYQKLLPMLATAIYAGAAGILDDMEAPVIGDMTAENGEFTVTADDGAKGTGIANLSVYRIKADGSEFAIAEDDSGSVSFKTDPKTALKLKVVAEDAAGNMSVRYFKYNSKEGVYVASDVDLSNVKVAKIAKKVYNGKAIKPAVKLTYKGEALKAGTDYTVAYKNNVKVGKATVTITGKGDYVGSVKTSFVIAPAKAQIAKIKGKKKAIAVTIKNQKGTGVAGYQIAYKKAGAKKFKTVKTTNAKKTIKKLVKNKKYTVKVRAYAKIGGKTYYGAYSKAKTVKTY